MHRPGEANYGRQLEPPTAGWRKEEGSSQKAEGETEGPRRRNGAAGAPGTSAFAHSVLHLVLAFGAVEALIGNGASLDTPVGDCYVVLPWCGRGSTALHLAAALGHEAISRAIIAAQERTPSMDLVRMRNNQVREGVLPCLYLVHMKAKKRQLLVASVIPVGRGSGIFRAPPPPSAG